VVLRPLQAAKTFLLDRVQVQTVIRVGFQIGRGFIASVCEQMGDGVGVFSCTDLQSNMAHDSKKRGTNQESTLGGQIAKI